MKNFFGSIVVRHLFLLSIFLIPHIVVAEELGSAENPPLVDLFDKPLGLDIHGFVSQGAMLTTGSNYLMQSKGGSFEFNEFGLNFTKPLTNKLRLGVQLFARKLGDLGNYDVKADWFYLDYHFMDELGIRAGRVKVPFGFYNDTSDIDSARVPILLPQSVYPTTNRDFLLAQTGMELYGRIKLNYAGALAYRAFGGVVNIDVPAQTGPVQYTELKNRYAVGGRLLWETPFEGLRVGGNLQYGRVDTKLSIPPITAPLSGEIFALIYVGSAEYAIQNWLLTAEYSRWHVTVDSNNPTVFPSVPTVINERMYGMASYRFTDWFQSGLYYSVFFPDAENRSGRQNQQQDLSTTLRFDINPYWLVKLEGHYMHGTAAVDPVLNDNKPNSAEDKDWAAFLIKTTVYF